MNREIKFRVYDKENNKMYIPVSELVLQWNKNTGTDLVNELVGTDGKWDCTDVISKSDIMQYAGLKDKNGREIYEGDIVGLKTNKNDPEFTFTYEVRFEGTRFVLYHTKCSLPVWGNLHRFNDRYIQDMHFEVIGNIHENTELIK